MRKVLTYAIHDVEPYINWLYFYHAWQVGQKGAAEREALDSDAREMLIKATRNNPDDGRAVFLLGQVYLASGDVADARALYRSCTDNLATAAGAFNGLALCDIAEQKYEDALKNVQAGLAVGDASAEQGLLFNEIVLYERLGEWVAAKQRAAAYLGKYPSDEAGIREYEFLSTR